jgi:hypothetical protein
LGKSVIFRALKIAKSVILLCFSEKSGKLALTFEIKTIALGRQSPPRFPQTSVPGWNFFVYTGKNTLFRFLTEKLISELFIRQPLIEKLAKTVLQRLYQIAQILKRGYFVIDHLPGRQFVK